MLPPVKSGCDFCPFTGKNKVRAIAGKDPARFKKILQLDNIDSTGRHLFEQPLTLSHSLTEYDTQEEENLCNSGHCFT